MRSHGTPPRTWEDPTPSLAHRPSGSRTWSACGRYFPTFGSRFSRAPSGFPRPTRPSATGVPCTTILSSRPRCACESTRSSEPKDASGCRWLRAALSPTYSPDYDARIRENFVERLVSIPVQRKKRMAILRWLVEDFRPGTRYPESEVNRIITRRHPDFATLRRYLVDEELMQRQHGIYWRTGTVPNIGHDPH